MSRRKKYILVCTDYVTKCVEVKALYSTNEQYVIDFLFEEIFTHFGVPQEIVTDQGTLFTSNLVKDITEQYKIKHRKSSPYHPQENGQVESTNKAIEVILTKTV
jgi:transposase InsO family protein